MGAAFSSFDATEATDLSAPFAGRSLSVTSTCSSDSSPPEPSGPLATKSTRSRNCVQVIITFAVELLRMYSRILPRYPLLTGTSMAPAQLMASHAATASNELGSITSTVSPRLTPSCARPPAQRSARSWSWRYVISPPVTCCMNTRSGNSAARSAMRLGRTRSCASICQLPLLLIATSAEPASMVVPSASRSQTSHSAVSPLTAVTLPPAMVLSPGTTRL